MLRPWDNVPKKALAQEVTGSRIVYANYTQNYDLGLDGHDEPIKPGLNVDFKLRKNIGDFQKPALIYDEILDNQSYFKEVLINLKKSFEHMIGRITLFENINLKIL